MTLPTAQPMARAADIDQYRSTEQTDRRTDRRTPYRYIDAYRQKRPVSKQVATLMVAT